MRLNALPHLYFGFKNPFKKTEDSPVEALPPNQAVLPGNKPSGLSKTLKTMAKEPIVIIPAPLGSTGASVNEAGEPLSSDVSPPTKTMLSNGLSTYLQQAANRRYSSLNLLLPIYVTDPSTQMLLGNLLLQGSKATQKLVDAYQSQGISFGVYPEGDQLSFEVSGPAGSEAQMAQAAWQLLNHPQIDPAVLESHRATRLKNLTDTANLPDVPMGDSLNAELYGAAHPYALSVPTLIDRLQNASAQQALLQLKSVMAQPQRLQVLLVSPQPVASQAQLLNQWVQQNQWFASPVPLPVKSSQPVPKPVAVGGQKGPLLFSNDSVERAHVCQTWRAPTMNDPDYVPFTLLTKLLGGMSGGFFNILRSERGLVYSTRQSFNPQVKGADFSVSAEVDFDKLGPALTGIQEAMGQLMQTPVDMEELDKVKRETVLALRKTKQSSGGIASLALNNMARGFEPEPFEVIEKRYLQVEPTDIQRVAQRFFSPHSGYSVLGITAPKAVLSQLYPGYLVQAPQQVVLPASLQQPISQGILPQALQPAEQQALGYKAPVPLAPLPMAYSVQSPWLQGPSAEKPSGSALNAMV